MINPPMIAEDTGLVVRRLSVTMVWFLVLIIWARGVILILAGLMPELHHYQYEALFGLLAFAGAASLTGALGTLIMAAKLRS